MAVRAAGPEDFEEVVARLRALPLAPQIAWALAPATDLAEAQTAFARWLAAGLLRVGDVWLGDDGTMAGGRRLRVRLAERFRAPDPAHGKPNVGKGGFTYPDVPAACQRRLWDLAVAGLRLRSSGRRTFLVQIWGAAGDEAGIEPLEQLISHAREVRHACLAVASGPAGTDRLRRAGFTPGRDAPAGADGRPTLTAWEIPA